MTLEAFQRRQARPIRREAADWIDDKNASILFACPPYPPIKKAPPTWGKPYEGRGPGDRFSRWDDSGSRVDGSNPWIAIIFCCDFLGLAKLSGRLTVFTFPRIAPFFPRVGRFIPRACFSAAAPFFLLFFFFERERERGEGKNAETGDPRIQFVTRGYKTYGSWKKRAFHEFSGDAFLSNLQCWRGFACVAGLIHGFFTRYAPLPPAAGRSGGCDGHD